MIPVDGMMLLCELISLTSASLAATLIVRQLRMPRHMRRHYSKR
jgi:hypothetical protein